MRPKLMAGTIVLSCTALLSCSAVAGAATTTPCPNESLRVGPSAALPDCRGYEMVSPLDKNGGDVQTLAPAGGGSLFSAFKQSSLDGSKVTYSSATAFADAVAGPWSSQYISTRGASGWSTHGISPPRGRAVFEGTGGLPPTNWETENLFEAFTADLCHAWLRDSNVVPLAPDGLHGYVNLYRRSNCVPEGFEALSKAVGGPFGPVTPYLNDRGEFSTDLGAGPGLRFMGASTNLSHQVFVSGAPLLPDEVGDQVQCSTTTAATTISYQWLRNGVPIEGATASTYILAPADQGTAVQCQVFATNTVAGSTQVANPPHVVAPAPSTPGPVAPATIAAPEASGTLAVGGPGGQTLTCDPRRAGTDKDGNPIEANWGGSPTFAYQWYRNGAPLAGATASTYNVTASDLAGAAVFQCAVIATNAGGSVVKVSNHRATSPAPSPAAPGGNGVNSSANASVWSKRLRLYDLHNGQLELVGILPDGTPNPENSVAGTLGSMVNTRESLLENAVSDDGSKIFWTSKSGSTARGAGQLYVRVEGAHTLEVSKTAEELSGASQSMFWKAAADGSAVLFSTGSFNTLNITTNADLYEFDVETEATRLIAQEVPGVLGAADDLTRIYFVSKKALAAGAVEGAWNLYSEEGGASEGERTITLIGTLSADDSELHETGVSAIRPDPVRRASRVTAEGRHAAFQALTPLTGYDNTDSTGKRYTEVFHYDAAADELTCVSCDPNGPPAVGGPPISIPYSAYDEELKPAPTFRARFGEAATLPAWEREHHASRVLSEDGNRVFFHSHEALVVADTNGVEDVYQWEAQGSGSCEQTGGCVNLISTGTSAQTSEFVDASASGDDVFFATSSSLDPRDEGSVDLYDAKVGGGFPIPPPPPECEGDACKSIPAPPDDPTPTSTSFKGPGDPLLLRDCRPLARHAAKLTRLARRTDSRRIERRAKQARKRLRRCRRANREASQ